MFLRLSFVVCFVGWFYILLLIRCVSLMGCCEMVGVETILFDLSGTLVDDLQAVYQGYLDLCNRHDREKPSLLEFRKQFKLPYPEFLVEKGYIDVMDAINFWQSAYKNHGSSIKIFDDVIPALKELKRQGLIKLGVVSQTPKEQVEQNLRKFNLESYFDNIVLDRWKPNPKGLLQALNELKISNPENVVYIGDMKEDLQAAHQAKIQAWAIYRENGSFNTLENIKKGKPLKILTSLSDII